MFNFMFQFHVSCFKFHVSANKLAWFKRSLNAAFLFLDWASQKFPQSDLWKWRNDRRSERYLRNCVKKLEKKKKFRTSTGCEPMTSRLRMRCSTNWAMKPLTLGAGQLHKLRSRVLSPEPLRFVWICLAFLLLRILYITRATKGYHFDLTVRFRHWSLTSTFSHQVAKVNLFGL